ncbi:MAG TPA: hypothetical protein DHM37_08105 [Candidatus Cloacimonas sp.]|nr:hypothetical protein [Candidatus Cloacimonas sp.]
MLSLLFASNRAHQRQIYNLKGQLIRTFPIAQQQNFVWWNGENDAGEDVSSGIYLYQLRAAGISQTKKMVLIK